MAAEAWLEVTKDSAAGLASVWRSVASELPQGWELGGVTYQGPDHDGPWVAFLYEVESAEVRGPEGLGSDPEAALTDLSLKLPELRDPAD
jgi:hypothetical protein